MGKINFQELLKDKKFKNALVIGIAVIGAIIFLYFMFGGNDKTDVRDDKEVMVGEDASRLNFGVPSSNDNNLETISKTDAFEQKISDSVNYARQSSDALVLSNGSTTSSSNSNDGFSDAEFESMRSRSLSNSKPTNNHSTYGNSSMWGNEIPSGSNVGYSDLGVAVERPRETRRKTTAPITNNDNYTNDYESLDAPVISSLSTKNNHNTESPLKKQYQLKAKLVSQGYATNNRSISFVILENFNLNGETLPKGKTFALGTLQVDNDRLFCKIHTIKSNGKSYNVAAKVFGYDGEDGLPIIGENSNSQTGQVIRDEAGNLLNNVPIVGGVINRATRGNSKAPSNKVALGGNIECTIVIFK